LWDDERILNLFKEERAKHFDPTLVDLFFENLDKFYAVRDKFKDNYIVPEQEDEKTEKIKILGAYGTKAKGFGTSAFYLNKKNVIDAGNLLDTLDEECAFIENIWLTHAHLDHIVDIAYVLDNYFPLRSKTLNIIGLPQTIRAIQENYMNNVIWPDFSKIKLDNSEDMAVKYTNIEVDETYTIGDSQEIRAFETDHTVESCGYIYKKNDSSVLITADTYSLSNMIKQINRDKSIKSIVVECSFPSSMKKLAEESKHLTPKILFEMIEELKSDELQLYINHVKPSYISEITTEIEKYRGKWEAIILKDGDFIKF
jgi:ribonuclease BN (tRNA processing enzyme)